jgi:hypothetical protein
VAKLGEGFALSPNLKPEEGLALALDDITKREMRGRDKSSFSALELQPSVNRRLAFSPFPADQFKRLADVNDKQARQPCVLNASN